MSQISEPMQKFEEWFTEARRAIGRGAEIATLATVDESGQPSARMINYKGLRQGGFSFFSNYLSRKGIGLSRNPKSCLVFYWPSLKRQVRVEGKSNQLIEAASDEYFFTRDRASQVTASLSRQSEVLSSFERFVQECEECEGANQAVLRPAHWGGYYLEPNLIEFWENGPARRHKRLEYRKIDGQWRAEILYP